MNVLGIDIGGTKIFIGKYDQNFNLLAETTIPTQAQKGKEQILKNLLHAIDQVKDEQTQSFGISWAGFVDSENGIIEKAPNIPALNNFSIIKYLEEETGLKGVIGNDARLFALAEATTQKIIPTVSIGVIIGTGVGSGLIIDGKIFSGAHNFAGEIGHQRLGKEEIEKIVAGPALEKFLNLKNLSDIDKSIDKNHAEVLKKIDYQFQTLTQWVANVCLAFDPSEVVIGGGAGIHFWSHFKEEIINTTNEKLKDYPIDLNLRFSKLKNAGAQGAAVLAWKIVK